MLTPRVRLIGSPFTIKSATGNVDRSTISSSDAPLSVTRSAARRRRKRARSHRMSRVGIGCVWSPVRAVSPFRFDRGNAASLLQSAVRRSGASGVRHLALVVVVVVGLGTHDAHCTDQQAELTWPLPPESDRVRVVALFSQSLHRRRERRLGDDREDQT